jgi:hypothetical protein
MTELQKTEPERIFPARFAYLDFLELFLIGFQRGWRRGSVFRFLGLFRFLLFPASLVFRLRHTLPPSQLSSACNHGTDRSTHFNLYTIGAE